MKKILFVVLLLCCVSILRAQTYEWKFVPMDGSRTGVRAAGISNIEQALGRTSWFSYFAPNGKIFRRGSTPKVAKIMLKAQEGMKEVKTVIGYSSKEMIKEYPESALSNWFVDNLMEECPKYFGKKADIGIANFGGIRLNMPKGEIYKDDILSMFPFKNSLVYVSLKGKDVREILEYMAEKGFQAIGGVRCVAKNKKLISATVNGEPLDDEKIYGVATISFLLDGGDNFYIGKNALEIQTCPCYLYDNILDLVKRLTAQGKAIEYNTDGRVTIIYEDKECPR